MEICQFAVKGDTSNFRRLIVSFEGTMQATCETLRAIECSGDFKRPILRRRETPEAHTDRNTGCSALHCMLPGCWCMPISILNCFSCIIPLLPVVTTMPNGVLFSLFILKELTSRCCYSTMGLPGM